MANSRSARKRIRANEVKRVRNRTVRSAARTKVARARHALLALDQQTESAEITAQVHDAIQALDRAAEKGILHRNNVRRRASRLASMASALLQSREGADEAETEARRAAAAGGQKGKSGRRPARAEPAKPAKAAKVTAKPAPAAKVASRGDSTPVATRTARAQKPKGS